ncbi:magnesium-translocating P-type ATPase [Desulfovibrio sp. TomC]|uniref:magnesium-translocating P-type ATPase n=1 Tax=Desulfovibrio sp. TomC TaxID=1562888 RepID=UPI00057314F7|nr:magnesium-translocating P-type ATPase [Desulfovibrio sp. TomC]KHK00479.1 Mg(2+) transport ATPase, P-type [Desulfovibrio sp. TomC]
MTDPTQQAALEAARHPTVSPEVEVQSLAPEEEFLKHLEHFSQKANVFATLAAKNKIAPYEAFTHLHALWAEVERTGARLTEPVPMGKPAVAGLTSAQARERLRQYGLNQAGTSKRITLSSRIVDAVKNPLVLLLFVLGGISYATNDVRSAVVIIGMAVLGVTLKVIQEAKADTAAEQLKKMVHTTATVLRDGEQQEIPMTEVVPGDMVLLSAGDMVPADVQLVRAKDLHVNQAMLTGEALPVEKVARAPGQPPIEGETGLGDLAMCFMGTNVVSGSATALVMATGTRTYFGGIAAKLSEKRPETDFDKGIKKFTMLMLRFMMVMVPFVFVINGATTGDWMGAFMFALAVAVGLTPEMLPMVVTVCLSKGALAMAKHKVIVKRLDAIQNFGAIDILCTDKTGTLTQDKIILEKYLDVTGEEDNSVLEYAYVNSKLQTGLRNALDMAVISSGDQVGAHIDPSRYELLDEIPFDFMRRRLSVIVRDTQTGRAILICKGAAEEVFAQCRDCLHDGVISPLDDVHRETMQELVHELNDDGFRVVALAFAEVDGSRHDFAVADECNLTLMGYLAFLDPPKDTAADALAAMLALGIQPKILTGDNAVITAKICREVRFDAGDHLITGEAVAAMTEAELAEAVEICHVFAKLDPMQKEAIVKALRARGHVVGFMGDGINDAPALRAADIGISVDSAVDVAKESADIILLEKSLAVLEHGVAEGRKIFFNITKYIRMGASSNFGNMFSVLGASAFLPYLPMLPIQILVNNLMYDFSQTAIPTDNVDAEIAKQPKRWRIDDIRRYILYLGPVSSLFDYVTFFILLHVFGAWDNAALFQTGWFIESLLSQTLIVHVIRTDKIPFLQSRSSFMLGFTTVAICAVGVWLPFSPLADYFGLVVPPASYWGLIALVIFCYMCLAQIVKTWVVRRIASCSS